VEKEPVKNGCSNPECPCERRLQAILNAMPDLVFVLDAGGHYTSVSQQSDRPDLYKPPSEWIGKHQSEVLPEPLATRFQNAFDAILGGSEREELDYVLKVQDGSTRNFHAVVTPIRGVDGNLLEFCTVVKDVTKEMRDMKEMGEMVRLMTGREERMIELKKELKAHEAEDENATREDGKNRP